MIQVFRKRVIAKAKKEMLNPRNAQINLL